MGWISNCCGKALSPGMDKWWMQVLYRHPSSISLGKKRKPQGNIPLQWSEAKRRQQDVDASWTKKHEKSYFGYKISVNVDKRYKLVRKVVTDTASTHECQHFSAVLDSSNNTSRIVYADKGYASKAREAALSAAGLRNSDST